MNVQNIALDQTRQILAKALVNFAKEEKGKEIAPHQVTIIIGTKCLNPHFDPLQPVSETNPDADLTNTAPYYFVLKNNEPFLRLNKKKELTSEVTFNKILNVKFDVMGKGALASAFLTKAIARFAAQENTDPRNIEIMILTPKDSVEINPCAVLYDNGREGDPMVKQLNWEKDIFIADAEIDKQIMEG